MSFNSPPPTPELPSPPNKYKLPALSVQVTLPHRAPGPPAKLPLGWLGYCRGTVVVVFVMVVTPPLVTEVVVIGRFAGIQIPVWPSAPGQNTHKSFSRPGRNPGVTPCTTMP